MKWNFDWRKQFRAIYKQLYPHSKSTKFCDRIFTIFDYSKRNYLDFGEFLTAIAVTVNGSTKEKLTCAFKIYDLNSDGKLDRRELKKILGHIHEMLGEDNVKSRRAAKLANRQVELIFEKFNLSKNEKLTLEAFIEGCLRDEYLENLFKNNNYPALYDDDSMHSEVVHELNHSNTNWLVKII